jgi:cellulase/cellobiase CelA1
MTVANVRSELGWQFVAAGWAASIARLTRGVGRVGAGGSSSPAAKGGGDRVPIEH